MTTREIENRVRGLAWPSPPADLRARVLAAGAFRTAEAAAASVHSHPIAMNEPRAFRRPVWRTAPVVFVGAALIVIGACTGLDLWAKRELDVELARFQAKYGSLDEATSKVPAVPDSDNRARVVRAAVEFAVEIPGQNFRLLWRPVASPVPAELRAFADANRDAIRLLADIRTRHQSNWQIDGQDATYVALNSLSTLSSALFVAGLLDMEAGRPDDAADVIVSGLGIAASLRQESDDFPQKVRLYNVMPSQFDGIRHLISTSTPSATALKELAWWLAENRAPDSLRMALLANAKGTNAMFARMEKGDIDPGVVEYIYPMTWPEWPSVLVRPAARIGRPFVRMARVRSLRRFDQVLEDLARPRPRPTSKEPSPPQRWALVDRLVDKFTGQIWDYGPLEDDFASTLAVAEVGVALRRFKLDRFEYPNDLSALVPGYLDRLPIDPYTGRPPVYTRQGSGFTLQARASNPNMKNDRALEWDVKR
jgi:hypothetical protein